MKSANNQMDSDKSKSAVLAYNKIRFIDFQRVDIAFCRKVKVAMLAFAYSRLSCIIYRPAVYKVT